MGINAAPRVEEGSDERTNLKGQRFLPSAGEKDLLDGEEHDRQVHEPSGMLDIIQIVLEFLLAGVHAVAVRVIDLSPAGQAGVYGVTKVVVRY